MKHILLAALGDHPAVITSAVKAFYAKGTPISEVRLLFPNEGEQTDPLRRLISRIIGEDGVQMIWEYLDAEHPACRLTPEQLPFADAASVKDSVTFLHCLRIVLDGYAEQPDAQVHMLLAGGRKNMAALMALAAQFYPNVKGIYHLLDRREAQGVNAFASVELLLAGVPDGPARVRASLDQDIDHINLFSIPYHGASDDADLLREAVDRMSRGEPHSAALRLSPEAALFYKTVFARREPQRPDAAAPLPLGMEVWLSAAAVRQYRAWEQSAPTLAEQCRRSLADMADAARLHRSRLKDGDYPFGVYRAVGTTARAVYVTTPDPFSAYPNGRFEEVVICRFVRSLGQGEYDPPLSAVAQAPLDLKPAVRLTQLAPEERTLILPLGASPMVAAQTYQLLTESEAEGKPRVSYIALVYPQKNQQIDEQASLLKRLFKLRGVQAEPFPVEGIGDLDSEDACRAYLSALRGVIAKLRAGGPDRRIDLSLSGGRKGMSALALFAAQLEGVGRVYHTIITDRTLEKTVEDETAWPKLRKLIRDEEKAERLFLDRYRGEIDKFVLFPIPVIPFKQPPAGAQGG